MCAHGLIYIVLTEEERCTQKSMFVCVLVFVCICWHGQVLNICSLI